MEDHKRYNRTIIVSCDEPDQRFAEAFLDIYRDRIVDYSFESQKLKITLDMDGIPKGDIRILLDLFTEALSKTIRTHRKPSKPPGPLSPLQDK